MAIPYTSGPRTGTLHDWNSLAGTPPPNPPLTLPIFPSSAHLPVQWVQHGPGPDGPPSSGRDSQSVPPGPRQPI